MKGLARFHQNKTGQPCLVSGFDRIIGLAERVNKVDISFDFSKAFDIIPHKTLERKFKSRLSSTCKWLAGASQRVG